MSSKYVTPHVQAQFRLARLLGLEDQRLEGSLVSDANGGNAPRRFVTALRSQWGISQGASYVLVVGSNHYRLSGFDKELAKAAAENSVTVSGDLNGTDVTVTNVEPAHQTK
jgi:hypothetical protein